MFLINVDSKFVFLLYRNIKAEWILFLKNFIYLLKTVFSQVALMLIFQKVSFGYAVSQATVFIFEYISQHDFSFLMLSARLF